MVRLKGLAVEPEEGKDVVERGGDGERGQDDEEGGGEDLKVDELCWGAEAGV